MSFVKLQSARFLNWIQEKNAADSIESLIRQFDVLYESFASEHNVAGAVVDSLLQIAVEKPKKRVAKSTNSSGVSELTMNLETNQIVVTDVDGAVVEPVAKKPRAPKKTKTLDQPVVSELAQEPVVSEVKPKKRVVIKKPKTTEQPVVSEPVVSEPVVSEPVVHTTKPKIRVIKKTKTTEPVVQDPVVLEPVVLEPVVVPEEAKPKKRSVAKKTKTIEQPVVTEPLVVQEEAPAKQKRTYNKKPKVVEDTETNVVVVTPELVEEPIVQPEPEPEPEPEDAVELDEICINDETFYADQAGNLYNTEFVQVGRLENDQIVLSESS